MLSSGGEANEGLRPAGLPHRRAPLLIVLLIPLLACLGTATAAQGRYGLRGPAPSRALAADGRRLVATAAPTSVAEGGNATATEGGNDTATVCGVNYNSPAARASTAFSILFWFSLVCGAFFYCLLLWKEEKEEDKKSTIVCLILVAISAIIFLIIWIKCDQSRPKKCYSKASMQRSCIEAYGAENCISPFTNASRPIIERKGKNIGRHWLFTYQYEHCRAAVGKPGLNSVLRKPRSFGEKGTIRCAPDRFGQVAIGIILGYEHEGGPVVCQHRETREVRCPKFQMWGGAASLGFRAASLSSHMWFDSWDDIIEMGRDTKETATYGCAPSLHVTPIIAISDWTRYCGVYHRGKKVGDYHWQFGYGVGLYVQAFSAGKFKVIYNPAVKPLPELPQPTLAPTTTLSPSASLVPTPQPSLNPTAFGAKVVSGDLCISGMTELAANHHKSIFEEAIESYASPAAGVWYSVSVEVSSGCSTSAPSRVPTSAPTQQPTSEPSGVPTTQQPTSEPSGVPTSAPSSRPTVAPTLARRRRLQTTSSDELTIHYDIHTDTSAAVNVAVAMGDLSPAAFDDALDSVVPNDLTNVFASVTLTNVGNPTLASGTHPVGTAAQKPQDGEDSEDGARSSPGNQAILLVGGVLSVFFCGYIYYVKKTHYDKEDDVSYQFYFVIGIALMDFYSDVFFAQSAVGSERSTVRTLGYVMIGWVVAVVTVNGVLLVTIKRKYGLERVLLPNDEDGDPFDKAHSGLFTILALLTLTSAELLAVFPWRGRDSRE